MKTKRNRNKLLKHIGVQAALIVILATQCFAFAGTGLSGHLGGLRLCQETIKKMSKDYNVTKVPHAKNYGGSGEFYFAWNNRNPIKLADGRGGLVTATGSCTVNERTQKVVYLTINGKTIIEN